MSVGSPPVPTVPTVPLQAPPAPVGPLQVLPLPAAAVLGVMGAILVVLGLRDVWSAVRFRLRRPAPVGEAAGRGRRVVVSGIAREAGQRVAAPLTGRPCLAYAWRVTELRTMRSLDGAVDTFGQGGRSGSDAGPFRVEDDTGRLLVDATDADLRLDEEWVRDPLAVPGTDDASVLGELADGLLGVTTHGRRHYEGRLEDGETVTIRGRVVASDDGSGGGWGSDGEGVLVATLVTDAPPRAAAGRTLGEALLSVGAGLFVLAVVAVVLLLA